MYKHQGPWGQKGLLPDRGQEASDALRDSAGHIDVWGWGKITDIKDGRARVGNRNKVLLQQGAQCVGWFLSMRHRHI